MKTKGERIMELGDEYMKNLAGFWDEFVKKIKEIENEN